MATATAPVGDPAAPSPVNPDKKSVQFDLNPREQSPPERGEHVHEHEHEHEREGRSRRSSGKRRRRDDSPDSVASDATIELPERFDRHGRRKAEDPVADKLEQVLSGLFKV